MKPGELTAEDVRSQDAATEKERKRIADENNRASEIAREQTRQAGYRQPRKKWHPGLLEFEDPLLPQSTRFEEFFSE